MMLSARTVIATGLIIAFVADATGNNEDAYDNKERALRGLNIPNNQCAQSIGVARHNGVRPRIQSTNRPHTTGSTNNSKGNHGQRKLLFMKEIWGFVQNVVANAPTILANLQDDFGQDTEATNDDGNVDVDFGNPGFDDSQQQQEQQQEFADVGNPGFEDEQQQQQQQQQDQEQEQDGGPIYTDVIIIGAGAAGLAAAAELQSTDPDLGYILLESTDQIGGRVRATTMGAPGREVVVEEGANWIIPFKGNPMWERGQALGLAGMTNNYTDWTVYDETVCKKYLHRLDTWHSFKYCFVHLTAFILLYFAGCSGRCKPCHI